LKFAARIVLPLLLPLLLVTSGCHLVRAVNNRQCHDVQAFMKSTSVPPLKIPSGLDAPDTTNALKLPALNEPAPPVRRKSDPCLDEPPSFKVQQPSPPARTPQA
jgi:uncharacterized lipoprotein